MAIRHRQISGSGDGSITRDGNTKAVLKYAVLGTDDPLIARAYVLTNAVAPDVYDGKRLAAYQWDEIEIGYYVFSFSYEYNRLEPDEWRLAIDNTGGSIRMTTSFDTTTYGRTGETPPDFKGGIDVEEGKPRGIDRVIPASKWTITYRLTRPADILAYAAITESLTGTVNNAPILGRAAGEMLFLGATGDFGSDVDPQLQFSWAASKNATLTIGEIASVAKKGHEYLWVLYEEKKTGTGAEAYVVTEPRAAYVERIYDEADHSLLGLLL